MTRDLGPVTAYAYAVENGYFEGTEEEWIEMLSNLSKWASAIQTAAEAALSNIEGKRISSVSSVDAAEQTAVAAVQAQQSDTEDAIDDKAAAAIASIPETYADLDALVKSFGFRVVDGKLNCVWNA